VVSQIITGITGTDTPTQPIRSIKRRYNSDIDLHIKWRFLPLQRPYNKSQKSYQHRCCSKIVNQYPRSIVNREVCFAAPQSLSESTINNRAGSTAMRRGFKDIEIILNHCLRQMRNCF
jgi:hypothetical protein